MANLWQVRITPNRLFRVGEKTTITYVLKVGRPGIEKGGKIYISFGPNVVGFSSACASSVSIQTRNSKKPNYLKIQNKESELVYSGRYRGWNMFKNIDKYIPEGSVIYSADKTPDSVW